ncbi:UNVERIFIED_CONTAM: hypothetical protein Sindi_1651500 [Sesamum indicum]
MEELMNIEIVPKDLEKFTCIGSQLEGATCKEIIKCLRCNADIFAWTSQDLDGIDPNIITHHLNIGPRIQPVKQKKRHFGLEKDKIIQVEGYHQIMLAPEDRKRVSFITSAETFCYIVMSFGLKNTGSTYQSLVDKIFCLQLGRNMEVYVDDMLVKRKETQDHVRDLEEIFAVLKVSIETQS